jgi:hypothetical protein
MPVEVATDDPRMPLATPRASTSREDIHVSARDDPPGDRPEGQPEGRPGDLPEDLTFEDFLNALEEIDAPVDADLPTDWDGCVELVTLSVAELNASTTRLRDAGIEAHVELPDVDELRGTSAMASIFVPGAALRRARAVLGIEA